jgi:hypothetical protein
MRKRGGKFMTVKHRVKENFQFDVLEQLEYRYSINEGGYVSSDLATIVIDNRRPYIGQVMQFSQNLEEKHLNNVNELYNKGYLVAHV